MALITKLRSLLIKISLLIPIIFVALSVSGQGTDTIRTSGNTTGAVAKSSTEILSKPETLPIPPGGIQEFYRFVGENYKYPKEAVKAGIGGKVLVSFVVERDGSLTDLKLLKDPGHGIGEAALEMLKKSPKWTPGYQKGEPVRVQFTLPIQLNPKPRPNSQSKSPS